MRNSNFSILNNLKKHLIDSRSALIEKQKYLEGLGLEIEISIGKIKNRIFQPYIDTGTFQNILSELPMFLNFLGISPDTRKEYVSEVIVYKEYKNLRHLIIDGESIVQEKNRLAMVTFPNDNLLNDYVPRIRFALERDIKSEKKNILAFDKLTVEYKHKKHRTSYNNMIWKIEFATVYTESKKDVVDEGENEIEIEYYGKSPNEILEVAYMVSWAFNNKGFEIPIIYTLMNKKFSAKGEIQNINFRKFLVMPKDLRRSDMNIIKLFCSIIQSRWRKRLDNLSKWIHLFHRYDDR